MIPPLQQNQFGNHRRIPHPAIKAVCLRTGDHHLIQLLFLWLREFRVSASYSCTALLVELLDNVRKSTFYSPFFL
ncbi:MAG: hypothetical protein GY801_49140 [bacterium]|nr:hypothetical protein [bacterium]